MGNTLCRGFQEKQVRSSSMRLLEAGSFLELGRWDEVTSAPGVQTKLASGPRLSLADPALVSL